MSARALGPGRLAARLLGGPTCVAPWSRNRAALLAAFADGVPVKELSSRFGVHLGTINQLVRRAGLIPRNPALPASTRQEAARLYAEGLTLPQATVRLGISNDGARAGIIAYGGTLRSRGRQRVDSLS